MVNYVQRFVICSVLIGAILHPLCAQSGPNPLEQLSNANDLERQDQKPFHLKMSFQIAAHGYAPAEQGTVEEWWAGEAGYRVEIVSPSMHLTEPLAQYPESTNEQRNLYLVDQLLRAEIHPLRAYLRTDLKVHEVARKLDKLNLTCLRIEPTDNPLLPFGSPDFCADPASKALRLAVVDTDHLSVARNSIGAFHDTNVAMDVEVAYNGVPSITGHITALQTFDPVQSPIILSKDATMEGLHGPIVLGKSLTKAQPVYPLMAKAAHDSGTVILHVKISKEGKVVLVSAISSPSPALESAAIDAVRQWTYTPFTIGGQPVAVDTTIQVRFNMAARSF